MDYLKQIDPTNIPKHIAVIMDGNGRWAQQQGHERLYGHNYGVESVREVLKAAKELKVNYLTLYAFSTENWNRPKEEVEGLMDLLIRTIAGEVDELNSKGIRLLTIGDTEGLPEGCRNELKKAFLNDSLTHFVTQGEYKIDHDLGDLYIFLNNKFNICC